ncbi:amino acid ABC transporter permease [Mesorhizobium caraganae]|uniref:amino acid ABC transporter permease n=1 Tax=Mesorhizobium caraganae TaxID=483206 RepID=UPI00178271DC|nr:amino acid ABC transporter permease [Mesorhizobium caraganae]MBM2712935.1 amino acid ABC transporter permease [Mesorhizobium caraganae]
MFDMSFFLTLLPRFIWGAAVTLGVSLAGFTLGTVIALGLLLLARSRIALARWIVAIYTSFIRGTPLLVQILVIYYALPGLTGIELSPLVAGVLSLSFNSAAFIAENLRAGLFSIPSGQFEAASALALPRHIVALKVILPQLVRNIIPPMASEFTILVKASAILSVISVVELTRTAQHVMMETFRPTEAFCTAALIYFLILFTFSVFTKRLEHKPSGAPR